MSQAADPSRITTACPQCDKRFVVPAAHLGKQGRCPGCASVFRIALAGGQWTSVTAAPAPPAAPVPAATVPPPAPVRLVAPSVPTPPAMPASPTSVPPAAMPVSPAAAPGTMCGICQTAIGPPEATTVCPDCKHAYHAECWQYNSGCGMYGCPKAPPTVSLTSLEIPASYWGREDKNCPNCGQLILAAAVRCRFCGATFSSATPQSTGTFRQEMQTKAGLPTAQKASIWLLIFCLLPCTSPVALIVGLIWFLAKRELIQAMPPLNSALVKIALGVASFESALLLLIVLFRGLLA